MREKETPVKSRPKDHILRRLYAELRFSGESLRINGRAMVFALAVGVVVGLCGGSFVYLLGQAELLCNDSAWASLLLPLAGLVVVWLYRRGGIKTAGGTDLIVQAARGEQPVSRLLAPVIFLSTLLWRLLGTGGGGLTAGRVPGRAGAQGFPDWG